MDKEISNKATFGREGARKCAREGERFKRRQGSSLYAHIKKGRRLMFEKVKSLRAFTHTYSRFRGPVLSRLWVDSGRTLGAQGQLDELLLRKRIGSVSALEGGEVC